MMHTHLDNDLSLCSVTMAPSWYILLAAVSTVNFHSLVRDTLVKCATVTIFNICLSLKGNRFFHSLSGPFSHLLC